MSIRDQESSVISRKAAEELQQIWSAKPANLVCQPERKRVAGLLLPGWSCGGKLLEESKI
jgi:hypothetical protein